MAKKWRFGKSANGTVIHEIGATTISGEVEFARCDKKMLIQHDPKLGLVDVTCSKCKRYLDYKTAMAELEKPDPSTEKVPEPKSDVLAPKKKPKPKPKPSPEPKPTARTEAEPDSTEPEPKSTEPDSGEKKSGEKLTTENYKDKMNEANAPEKPEESLVPFISGKAPNKKIFIKHLPSGQTMFNDVHPKAEVTCLKYLNNVKIKWRKKEDKCPKGFITACRGAFEAAYKSHGIKTGITGTVPKETPEEAAEKAAKQALALLTPTAAKGSSVTLPNGTYIFTGKKWERIKDTPKTTDIPETKDTPKTTDIPETKDTSKRRIKRRSKTKDKPKRTIRRREKPETAKSKDKPKRQIKRRSENKDTPKTTERFDGYGFVKGDIRSFIASLMENGEVYEKIVKRTMKKFELPETKVKGKIQLIVRIFRQRKIPLTVVFMETKEKDYYHIV